MSGRTSSTSDRAVDESTEGGRRAGGRPLRATAALLVVSVMLMGSLPLAVLPALPGGGGGSLYAAADNGGPDEFGYIWADNNNGGKVNYQWMNISGTNELGIVYDDASAEIPLGFSFRFYGMLNTSVQVNSNGYLSFVNQSGWSDFDNTPLPQSFGPNAVIAPLWDDLRPAFMTTSHVWYTTVGRPGEHRCIITWENWTFYDDMLASITFQAVLFENGSLIKFQYRNLTGGSNGHSDGNLATVGIENMAGDIGTEYSFDEAVLADGLAIMFRYVPPDDHDMAVIVEPDEPWAVRGHLYKLWGHVRNVGNLDQTGVNVSLRVNGKPAVWSGEMYSIQAGYFKNIPLLWYPSVTGDVQVSFRVEPVKWENRTWNNWYNFSILVYPDTKLLVIDQAHSNEDFRFCGEFYGMFYDKGFTIIPMTEGRFTDLNLSTVTAVVIPPTLWYWTYSQEEYNYIHWAVNNTGMSLLVYGYDDFVGWDPIVQDAATNALGVDWTLGGTAGLTDIINEHALTKDVFDISIPSPDCTLNGTGPGAEWLVKDAGGENSVMVSESGTAKGHVICVADQDMLYNSTLLAQSNGPLASNLAEYIMGASSRAEVNPPQNLSVNDTKLGNSLWLTWDPPVIGPSDLAPDTYFINRSSDVAGPWTEIDQVDAGAELNITDTGLTDNEIYFYIVRGYNEANDKFGANSSTEGGTPTDQTAPLMVAGFAVTQAPGGKMEAKLTWTANTEADLDGYRITRSTDPGGAGTYFPIADIPKENVTHTDFGLAEGTQYYYKMKAFDEVPNYSTATDFATITPTDLVAPPVPENITVADTGLGNNLELTWDINGTALGDDTVKVRIYRTGNTSKAFKEVAEVQAGLGSWNDTGLTDGKTYFYNLSAIDDAVTPNESPQSATLNATPSDNTAPSAPTDLTVEDHTTGTGVDMVYGLRLKWNASTAEDVEGYYVYRGETAGFSLNSDSRTGKTNASTRRYDDVGLVRGVTYYYRVRAHDEVPNLSDGSNEVGVSLAQWGPPPTPGNLNVTSRPNGNALDISWDAVTNDTTVEFYRLHWTRNETEGYTELALNLASASGATTFAHTGLVDGVTYHYKVSSIDSTGNESTLSDAVAGVPSDIIPPDRPTGLSVSAVPDGNVLSVRWDANSEGDLEGYRLQRSFSPDGNFSTIAEPGPGAIQYTDPGLVDGQVYYYRLRAKDEVPNVSGATLPVAGVPADTLPPAVPDGLSAWDDPKEGSIFLAWNGVPDDDLEEYIIYRSDDGEDYRGLDSVGNSSVSYEDTTAEPGTLYYYRVAAIDEVPNLSEMSGAASAKLDKDDDDDDDGEAWYSEDYAGVPKGLMVAFVIVLILLIILIVLYMVKKTQIDRRRREREEDGGWSRERWDEDDFDDEFDDSAWGPSVRRGRRGRDRWADDDEWGDDDGWGDDEGWDDDHDDRDRGSRGGEEDWNQDEDDWGRGEGDRDRDEDDWGQEVGGRSRDERGWDDRGREDDGWGDREDSWSRDERRDGGGRGGWDDRDREGRDDRSRGGWDRGGRDDRGRGRERHGSGYRDRHDDGYDPFA